MAKNLTLACSVLALIAAIGYFLMGAGVIHAADLTLKDAPPAFAWIAGVFYLAAGTVLFLNKRWVPVALVIINVFPVLIFYVMWRSRWDVMFSAPGLITKIAQILLEIGLIFVLVNKKSGTKTATAK